jgi:hypothetical protein
MMNLLLLEIGVFLFITSIFYIIYLIYLKIRFIENDNIYLKKRINRINENIEKIYLENLYHIEDLDNIEKRQEFMEQRFDGISDIIQCIESRISVQSMKN